MTWCQ